MLPSYILPTPAVLNPPGNYKWVVYSITIGQSIYVGFTCDFSKRMKCHLKYINKIVNKYRLPPRIVITYANFRRKDILDHGVSFKIESYHLDGVPARKAESALIRNTNRDQLLNYTKVKEEAIIQSRTMVNSKPMFKYIMGFALPIDINGEPIFNQ